ncbi:hypothetical protein D9758_017974 [Tetrapyrgos nigripes]|uniref:Uncharacterized protein n=1 Tax=Tetrapyrgos nigripes TaxID=182062 RepID=A0A8H5C395_9AGAR|nr:hypothetical protein D9758_017974 [Tetrapyrgos nigripes]
MLNPIDVGIEATEYGTPDSPRIPIQFCPFNTFLLRGAQFALQNIPVHVNTILPGFFQSQMTDKLSPDQIDQWSSLPAPGTLNPGPSLQPGRQLEIGTAAAFLSSVVGEFVNAINLVVDGEITLVNP